MKVRRYPKPVRRELAALVERALDRHGFDPETPGELTHDVVEAMQGLVDDPPGGWSCDPPASAFDFGSEVGERLARWLARQTDVDAETIVARVERIAPLAWTKE